MISSDKKCQFCDSEATNVHSFILSTAPDNSEGFAHHDYFQKEIYTCNKHTLSCKVFKINQAEEKP